MEEILLMWDSQSNAKVEAWNHHSSIGLMLTNEQRTKESLSTFFIYFMISIMIAKEPKGMEKSPFFLLFVRVSVKPSTNGSYMMCTHSEKLAMANRLFIQRGHLEAIQPI